MGLLSQRKNQFWVHTDPLQRSEHGNWGPHWMTWQQASHQAARAASLRLLRRLAGNGVSRGMRSLSPETFWVSALTAMNQPLTTSAVTSLS